MTHIHEMCSDVLTRHYTVCLLTTCAFTNIMLPPAFTSQLQSIIVVRPELQNLSMPLISLQSRGPHLVHQCLGPPHLLTQRTDQLVRALPLNYATKSLKLPLRLRPSPPLSNAPIPRLTPLTIPNGIWIQSAVLPPYTFQTN